MFPIFDLVEATGTLGSRVSRVHTYLKSVPQGAEVSRISLALVDGMSGIVQPLAFSNNVSMTVENISANLKDVPSLEALARGRSYRVIDDIVDTYDGSREHSAEIINAGIRSSVTFPVKYQGALVGFVFINSNQPGYFTASRIEFLCPFATILSMMLIDEFLQILRGHPAR